MQQITEIMCARHVQNSWLQLYKETPEYLKSVMQICSPCPNSIMPKPSRKSDFNYAKDTQNVWFQLCKRHQEILKSIMQRRPESLNSIMPPGLTLHAIDPMYFVRVSRIKAESLERRDNSHSVWYTIIKVAIHLLFCTLAAVIRSSTRVESKACWDSLS